MTDGGRANADIAGALVSIVGEENVSVEQDILGDHSRCLGPSPVGDPLSVVRPGCPEEIQQIVRLANELEFNIVPASSGAPHLRGGAVPSGEGVILDLSRMKRIMRIDRRNKVAVIEPGVTFGELEEGAAKVGLKVLTPLLPRANKSVLASYLDREPITIPKYHWDMTDPLLCTEIIFGTGEFFRTGAAAGPGTLEEMWKAGLGLKNPMGPSATDIVRLVQGSQGTMGIVTWASVKLEVAPQIRRCYFLKGETFGPLIDFAYRVLRRKMTDEFFMLNAPALASMLAKNNDDIAALAAPQSPFTIVFCLAGYAHLPEKRLAYLEKDIADVAKQCGVEIKREIPGADGMRMIELMDHPCSVPYWKHRAKGAAFDIFFLSTLDKLPQLLAVMTGTVQESGFHAERLGLYVQPIQQGRACHAEFHLYYDPSDEAEARTAGDILATASERLAYAGAFFSRPYFPWVDVAYRRCPDTVWMLKELKRVFDPKNVLNRGKLCFSGVE